MSSSHILVVDDDKDTRELIEFLLRQEAKGYDLTIVGTAEEAVDLIADRSFDLYIFDYKLPEMSGIELSRYVRRSDNKTPIIFFSAMAYSRDKENAIKAGATEYLVKPNDLDKLAATVNRLIKN